MWQETVYKKYYDLKNECKIFFSSMYYFSKVYDLKIGSDKNRI